MPKSPPIEKVDWEKRRLVSVLRDMLRKCGIYVAESIGVGDLLTVADNFLASNSVWFRPSMPNLDDDIPF